ncbi:MAG: hypothetical protein ACRDL7_01930, partial [Gaiellaceae bacterium]
MWLGWAKGGALGGWPCSTNASKCAVPYVVKSLELIGAINFKFLILDSTRNQHHTTGSYLMICHEANGSPLRGFIVEMQRLFQEFHESSGTGFKATPSN